MMMPKSNNQKLKLWYLYKILNENTDENHPMSMPEIIAELKKYDISSERKSLYSDIETLINIGVDIISEKRDKYVYYIGERDFQLAELKLLVDFIQSSKFITSKKSAELIRKIEGLTSKNNAIQLQKQVYVYDRVKTNNERIYYNISDLYFAINSHKKVKFKYYKYNVTNNVKFKNDGNEYIISPYALVCSDDNYYLLSNYPKYNGITHFRVDKMIDISVIDENIDKIENVVGKSFNLSEYIKKIFNMYGGETKTISLECDEDILNVVIDKFGDDLFLRKGDNNKAYATIKADVSPTFFSWLFQLKTSVKIISPADVADEYKKYLDSVLKIYK